MAEAAWEAERAVGIECFANKFPGFTAILKHRYADFKVNEVNLEGQVVHLTTLNAPPKAAPEPAATAADSGEDDPAAVVEAAVQQYAAASGSADLELLRAFLQAAQRYHAAALAAVSEAGGGRGRGGRGSAPLGVQPPAPLVLPPMADKAARTAVHQLFRALPSGPGGFPRMETNTVDAPQQAVGAEQTVEQQPQQQGQEGKPEIGSEQQAQQEQRKMGQQQQQQAQCIQVEVVQAGGGGGRGGGRGQKRKWRDSSDWAGGPGRRYLKFVLYKENMDSQQALSSLCKLLRVGHKIFAVAGTKDKRGVTAQQVTAFKLDPARLAALNPRLRGMRVGNFEFVADQLRLGDLQGNRFELVLRGVESGSAEAVAAAADGLRSSGFVNYYGLQRFGTGAVPTHRVGQALLRGRWREAVRMLLTPRPGCARGDQAEACRLYLEGGEVEGALRLMPRFLVAEPALLQGLKQHGPNGFLNALMCIPRNLRTMYIHAYQSYLWNAAASHRVRTYGASAVVEGDLVLPRAAAAERAASRNRGRARRQQQAEAEGGADAEGAASEAAGAGEDAAAATEVPEELEADVGGLGEVHIVTAAEAAAGTFSMDDVVLPLPGHAVRLPGHATADVYRSLAAADGVSLDASPHGAQDFSMTALSGAYRHVIYRPADLECQLLRYSDPDADLALTDLQVLHGQQLPPAVAPDDAEGGRLLGLRLAFTLPASCYATMLIRELTKQPTGAEHHKALQQGGATPAGRGGGKPSAELQEQGPVAEQREPQAGGRAEQALQNDQLTASGSEPAHAAAEEPSSADL